MYTSVTSPHLVKKCSNEIGASQIFLALSFLSGPRGYFQVMKSFVSIRLTGRILAPKFPLGNERWLHRQKAWPSLQLRIRRRPTIPEKRRQDEPPHEPKCVLFLIEAGSAKWVEMKNSWCIFSVKSIEHSEKMDKYYHLSKCQCIEFRIVWILSFFVWFQVEFGFIMP